MKISSIFNKKIGTDNQALFNNWITKIIQCECPDNSIIAINIGIFESENGFQLYFAGFRDYTEDDDDDWASGLGDFSPKDKYLLLNNSEFEEQDWEYVQIAVSNLISNFIKTDLYKDSFLEKIKVITTGFDDGDLIKIK